MAGLGEGANVTAEVLGSRAGGRRAAGVHCCMQGDAFSELTAACLVPLERSCRCSSYQRQERSNLWFISVTSDERHTYLIVTFVFMAEHDVSLALDLDAAYNQWVL